jgi:hypothetical protein
LLNRSPRPAPELRVVQPTATETDSYALSRRVYATLVVAVLALGLAVRAGFVLSSDFPLNDGGMFLQMTGDLQANRYALPHWTAYNGGDIPFAYPPLGFYLAAALDDLTPLGLFDAFRFIPLVASLGVVGAFLVLARAVLPGRMHVLVALLTFTLLPATFQWMIMGGGVTRAPGFALALLAMAAMYGALDAGSPRRGTLAGALVGLALLCHLEMGLVAVYSIALFSAANGRTREGVRVTLATAFAAFAVAAPWAALVIARHGIEPFTAAALSGTSTPFAPVILLLRYDATIEPYLQLVAALSLIGAWWLLARRQFLLPCWLVVTAALDGRAFPTSASFIVAMMAAYAVVDVLLPLVRNAGAPRWLVPAATTAGLVCMLVSALAVSPRLLTGATHDERDAMAWVAEHTPADSRFVVVSGDRWPVDRTSEWFPALTGRTSVATVQGREWAPNGGFRSAIADYEDLQRCAEQDAACLDAWTRDTGESFDYVYIPKLPKRFASAGAPDCCQALRLFLAQDGDYALVYDGPGAVIFERER